MNLIDSKDLSVALLDLFQLPQKIPKIQIHQPNTNQSNITNKIIKKKKPNQSTKNTIENNKIKSLILPELGLGANLVGGPELHAVNLGMLIGFRWESPPDNLVLVKLRPKI